MTVSIILVIVSNVMSGLCLHVANVESRKAEVGNHSSQGKGWQEGGSCRHKSYSGDTGSGDRAGEFRNKDEEETKQRKTGESKPVFDLTVLESEGQAGGRETFPRGPSPLDSPSSSPSSSEVELFQSAPPHFSHILPTPILSSSI